MEVKPGYELTEVGVIPEDWRLVTVEQISVVGRGRVISHKEIARSRDPKYPVYSSQTSDNGVMGYLDTHDFDGEYVTWTTDGANAGTVFHRTGKFNCTNVCGTIKLKSDNAAFVANVLGRIAPRHVSRHLGNPKLMNDVMKRVVIPLPPTKAEQEAIAGALREADALLESLAQLLAKKRHLKQAAMQQLLTGQTRLPGFTGKRETKTLGELGEISGGGVDKKIRPDEPPVRLVNYMDVYRRTFIFSKDLNHVVSARPDQAARCAVRRGDVFFTPSSEMPFDIAVSALAMEDIPDAAYSYHVVRLRLYADWDFLYRAYAFKSHEFLSQAARACEGSGVRYVITQTKFRQLSVRFPTSKEEQTAIAGILSDMDGEIGALETKLAKARQLKQGMMQELLTGRTRLK